MSRQSKPTPPNPDKQRWLEIPEGGHPMGPRVAALLNEAMAEELKTTIPDWPLKILYPSHRFKGGGKMRAEHKTDVLRHTATLLIIRADTHEEDIADGTCRAVAAFEFPYDTRPTDLKSKAYLALPAKAALAQTAKKIAHAQGRCDALNASHWTYANVLWSLNHVLCDMQPTANISRPGAIDFSPDDLRLCVVTRNAKQQQKKSTRRHEDLPSDMNDCSDASETTICVGIIRGFSGADTLHHVSSGFGSDEEGDVVLVSTILENKGDEDREGLLRGVMARYEQIASGYDVAKDWRLSSLFSEKDLLDEDEEDESTLFLRLESTEKRED